MTTLVMVNIFCGIGQSNKFANSIVLWYYYKVLQYFGITTSQSIAISITKSQSIAILIAKFSSVAKNIAKSIGKKFKYCKKHCKNFQVLLKVL